MHYRVQNWVSRPNIDDFRHPTWTYQKVFEKMPEKCGKKEGENNFFPLWCLIQKLDHNSGLHAKNQREISKNEVRKPPPTLCMEMWTFPFKDDFQIVLLLSCFVGHPVSEVQKKWVFAVNSKLQSLYPCNPMS